MNNRKRLLVDTPEIQVGVYDTLQFEDELAYFERIIKLKKHISGKSRQRLLLRKGITYCILADRVGRVPEELAFGKTEKGKPFLKNEMVAFNISHSKRYLAIAMSDAYEVGVDIQTSLHGINQFPYMILSHQEMQLTKTMSRQEKEKFLLRIWTCKEAIVKATGDGLTVDVSRIDLSCVMWPATEYEGSLSYEDRKLRIKLHSIEQEDFVCSYALINDTILEPDL